MSEDRYALKQGRDSIALLQNDSKDNERLYILPDCKKKDFLLQGL